MCNSRERGAGLVRGRCVIANNEIRDRWPARSWTETHSCITQHADGIIRETRRGDTVYIEFPDAFHPRTMAVSLFFCPFKLITRTFNELVMSDQSSTPRVISIHEWKFTNTNSMNNPHLRRVVSKFKQATLVRITHRITIYILL